MQVKFIIPGPPKGKARPRMTKAGHTYTPKDTVVYENLVKLCYMEQVKHRLHGALEARIWAYYPVPKSASKNTKELMLRGVLRPTKKPDIDNICKSILDSLNDIAYADDKQITDIILYKRYAEEPRVFVKLMEVE